MSSHPNVLLICALTPDGLARKTWRDIIAEFQVADPADDIEIGGEAYQHFVAEGEYEEDCQISTTEGDIIIYDLVTYGYGEAVTWEKLEAQKNNLEAWAIEVCVRHHCRYEIRVSANYW
jgi:hypothetical protein